MLNLEIVFIVSIYRIKYNFQFKQFPRIQYVTDKVEK